LRALAESIRQDAKEKATVLAGGMEGLPQTGWVLIDFGDLIVHVFSPEKRSYYDLEDLWSEAHVVLHMH
jgi:ribosome-associated protein